MKTNILILIAILAYSALYSQANDNIDSGSFDENTFNPATGAFDNPEINEPYNAGINTLNPVDLDNDCTAFYTINTYGDIQKWTLDNGTVTGGDVILSTPGNSLAFCGEPGKPTFYITDYPNNIGIRYYDQNLSTWEIIPIPFALLNSGGYENHQYYMRVIGSAARMIYHFNGTDLTVVDSLSSSSSFALADIAVDTLGRGWTLVEQSGTDVLNVYDSTGLVNSYDIQVSGYHRYGAFFLNGQLYIGIGESGNPANSIVPVIIGENDATLGEPIPFMNAEFTDLASCQDSKPVVSSIVQLPENQISIFPNPTNGIIHFPADAHITQIEMYNLAGQLLTQSKQQNSIDLTSLPNGMYFAKMMTQKGYFIKKIIKQ